MLDYKREYERWLASGALNADEKAELQAVAGDEKEIESRFYGPLEFGTAGLRGTMKVGLHQMNVHVIRWPHRALPTLSPPRATRPNKRAWPSAWTAA